MQVCTICVHPNLKEINERLIKGESNRALSNQFNVTESSLKRHKVKHLPSSLTKQFEEMRENDSFDIMTKIDFLIKETESIYSASRNGGKDLLALKSLDSLRNHFQLLINISAQLHANRVLELELLKARNGEANDEEKKEFTESLKYLTIDELLITERIDNKRRNHTDDIIIRGNRIIPSKDGLYNPPMKFD
jgi:hypothetical protein